MLEILQTKATVFLEFWDLDRHYFKFNLTETKILEHPKDYIFSVELCDDYLENITARIMINKKDISKVRALVGYETSFGSHTVYAEVALVFGNSSIL